MNQSPQTSVNQFIDRWKASGASERANYQLFLTELCELLGVEKPQPATDKAHEAAYTFERTVLFDDGEGKTSTNFIDLYKQHCFVLEAKQGSDKAVTTEAEILGAAREKTKTGTATRDTRNWDREMKKAKEQALRYARSLPATEGWPPFLVVVDVGYCIDLYADFARQGKTYVPFPDPQKYRIPLAELGKVEIQKRLRLLFTDPLELDPSKRAAKVTRELAERLAKLASLFEQAGQAPEKVAGFLMRCLFTMFAEDVQLLPERSFTNLLKEYKNNLQYLPQALQALWISMDKGGFDPALRTLIPQFNGFLFKDQEALSLTEAQLDLLILASEADWSDVEPAIFGTLLERALQPRERHKLGAHYTPRAYVERLVMPTVIEPLREEWQAAQAAAALLESKGDEPGALQEIKNFHRRLCSVRVLDPACGSGNFLYVTLEHLKRLEGETTEYMAHFPGQQLGLDMSGGYTVTPAQLLGLEINPRAAAIADVVLWIGYLQWHFRTYGHARRLADPILRQYGNIKQQDAVLSFTDKIPRLDANGIAITSWDGYSTKTHPVTGLEVPDESARTIVYDYTAPKPAVWPEADFIVGNPPFVGNKRMRELLGDGYTEALRYAYKNDVPNSVDFVMYWWYNAAKSLASIHIDRFGFITTNSITQSFNRKVFQTFLASNSPIGIKYAIPDHPWVDSSDGADVRIAISVVEKGKISGRLNLVIEEFESNDGYIEVKFIEKIGFIHADLKVGANLSEAKQLKSNQEISARGIIPHGDGFIVNGETKEMLLATATRQSIIKPYRNGRDINQSPRHVFVIDTYGFSQIRLRDEYPAIYQWLLERVKPERDENNDKSRRENWWLHARSNEKLRTAISNLNRYIVTVQTSKFRNFIFLDGEVMPDDKLIAIGFEDAYFLGILSSYIHTGWASATGGRLGVGNDLVYDKTYCFDSFPFPVTTNMLINKIRIIAEHLDAHRKQRQAIHATLTITDMYNVLEKLRSGEALNTKEQKINEQGLVSILWQLHNELDAAVAEAYGWPANLTEEEILEKLVALNKERAAEEKNGLIRWLRPEYQNPGAVQQGDLGIKTTAAEVVETKETAEWPTILAEQAQTLQRLLQQYQKPVSALTLSSQFKQASTGTRITKAERLQKIANLLETFSALGLLRKTEEGLYVK